MKLLAAVAMMLASVTSVLADPTGTYTVEGTNPGGTGTYGGTVTVEPMCETYRVTLHVSDQQFVGTGIGRADFVVVAYQSGNQSGLAAYARDPASGTWAGDWTYAKGRKLGRERWLPP